MACSAELVESKDWNEYSEIFFVYNDGWRSSVITNVKIIAKGKKVGVLFRYLRVCENFISLIMFCYNSRNTKENENSGYNQLHKEWDVSKA